MGYRSGYFKKRALRTNPPSPPCQGGYKIKPIKPRQLFYSQKKLLLVGRAPSTAAAGGEDSNAVTGFGLELILPAQVDFAPVNFY